MPDVEVEVEDPIGFMIYAVNLRLYKSSVRNTVWNWDRLYATIFKNMEECKRVIKGYPGIEFEFLPVYEA